MMHIINKKTNDFVLLVIIYIVFLETQFSIVYKLILISGAEIPEVTQFFINICVFIIDIHYFPLILLCIFFYWFESKHTIFLMIFTVVKIICTLFFIINMWALWLIYLPKLGHAI